METTLKSKYTAVLKLIRVENLVMIILTQFMLRYLVLQKILMNNGLTLEMNDLLFFAVVLSTVLIAAGGYIINDYFDVKTDMINHPGTVVVDRHIKRRWVIMLHLLVTAAGVGLGLLAALKTGYLRLAIFHIVAAILLWFYSTDLKKSLLTGNIVVSLLTAAVAFMPLVYEMGKFEKTHPGFVMNYTAVVLPAVKITVIFGVFAFITSMAREIIKDMEDYQGDLATGGHTLPIAWGLRSGRLFVFFLLIITALLLMFVLYNSIHHTRVVFSISNIYIFAGLVLPLTCLSFYILGAENPLQFRRASLSLKIIMLLGLFYSIIYYLG